MFDFNIKLIWKYLLIYSFSRHWYCWE